MYDSTPAWSTSEEISIRVAVGISSLLSFIGSIVILRAYIVGTRNQNFYKVSLSSNIIAMIALSDLLSAIPYVVYNTGHWDRHSKTACVTEAFGLAWFELTSIIWTCIMATNLVRTTRRARMEQTRVDNEILETPQHATGYPRLPGSNIRDYGTFDALTPYPSIFSEDREVVGFGEEFLELEQEDPVCRILVNGFSPKRSTRTETLHSADAVSVGDDDDHNEGDLEKSLLADGAGPFSCTPRPHSDDSGGAAYRNRFSPLPSLHPPTAERAALLRSEAALPKPSCCLSIGVIAFYVVPFLLPFAWAMVLYVHNRFGQTTAWCWVIPDDSDVPWRMYSFLPVFFGLVWNVVAYMWIRYELRGSAHGDTPYMRQKRVIRQLSLYLIALAVVYLPAVANRVYEECMDWESDDHGDIDLNKASFALTFLQALLQPLQGFCNCIVYYASVRKRREDDEYSRQVKKCSDHHQKRMRQSSQRPNDRRSPSEENVLLDAEGNVERSEIRFPGLGDEANQSVVAIPDESHLAARMQMNTMAPLTPSQPIRVAHERERSAHRSWMSI